MTGNTVIDALHLVSARLDDDPAFRASLDERFDFLDASRKLILVTGHRRENFGESMERVLDALLDIAARDDVEIVSRSSRTRTWPNPSAGASPTRPPST